ncbi:hypothetical protein MTQ01_24535 [Streptomyces sp. XM4193]|uniref:hypothetical protein n=1 Tax=Streptomyces sp. XM4193 TaxID=2929782 RepID=UPI001FFA939B|nr:hypothetical protein [Streptomyces sp. XM4193]MCK1799138.1 hypothetical protein [Streptomyces sp. XM4193]
MLRIKVYAVNPRTGERRTIKAEHVVDAKECSPFQLSMALPPCRCPIHREKTEREEEQLGGR